MPSPAPIAKDIKPIPIPRTRIPLSSAAPVYFVPERDPLLPPTIRPTEFPMSSQSDSSPVKPPYMPLQSENQPEGFKGKQEEMEEQEDEEDFDGIEDVPLSQYIPPIPRSRKKASVGITLDDLFSDEGNVEDMVSVMDPERNQNKSSQDSADVHQKSSPKARILSSSPIFASSSLTSKHRSYQSDTPASPLLHTPYNDGDHRVDSQHGYQQNHDDEIDEIGVEWTPSPMSQRTKARRFGDDFPVSGEMDTGSDLEIISPTNKRTGRYVGEGSSTSNKAKAVAEVNVDRKDKFGDGNVNMGMGADDFDDVEFFEGVDFDSLEVPTSAHNSASASGSTSNSESKTSAASSKPTTSKTTRPDQTAKSTIPDPGRAFRPSSTSTHTSTTTTTKTPFQPSSSRQSSPPSDILAMLDDQLRPDQLMMITDLTTAEQEFYKNHWRRGADKVKKRQEDYWSDGEDGGGPQPKKATKRAPAKRGFRGRGRARGRGRGRK